MLLNPSILALLLVSAAVVFLMLLAVSFGLQVLRGWDMQSGSERQLELERRTYLISTLLVFCFLAELVALLLFIYNAEQLSGRFVGAMCATGVLNINSWGWPTLFLKMALFFAGAGWLMVNRVDTRAPDYPLIRVKYMALLIIFPLAVAEAITQANFFLEMNPDVITSCCGSLFSPEGQGVAAEVSALQPATALLALIAVAVPGMASGFWVLHTQRGGAVFALIQGIAFMVALVAIVSFVALYIYEHPHHHCPFCILKSGHDYIGYLLYIPLFAATALALAVGVIAPFRRVQSLNAVITEESRRLVLWSLGLMMFFYLLSGGSVIRSNLSMSGVWW